MVCVLNNRHTFILRNLFSRLISLKTSIFFTLFFFNQCTQNTSNKNYKAMQWQLFLFSLDCIYSKILRQEFSGLIFFAPNVQNLLGRISFSSAVFVGWVTIFPTIILPCGLLISLPQPKYQENKRRPKIGQRKRKL